VRYGDGFDHAKDRMPDMTYPDAQKGAGKRVPFGLGQKLGDIVRRRLAMFL